MIKYTVIIFFLSFSLLGFGQKFNPTSQSNHSLNFNNFLRGVKYAYVVLGEKEFQSINNNLKSGNAHAIAGLLSYLKAIGFKDVKWGSATSTPQIYPSVCEMVLVSPSWGWKNSTFTDITMSFISCKGDVFKFVSSKNIWVTKYTNISTSFHNTFMKMYGFKKNDYLSYHRLSLGSEMTEWTEERIKRHFKEKGVDQLEGIYENTISSPSEAKYKLGIIKVENTYTLIYLSGAINYADWREGEVKAKLTATATPSVFKAEWKMLNKVPNLNGYISFEPGLMNVIIQDKDKSVYLKLYPTSNDNITSTISGPTSGTGFAITSNGLIITNHHVVTGSNTIKVRGVNEDFSKTYNASVIIEDKNNDLAIIKIDDNRFTSIETIPYLLTRKTSDVGSSVFVLGYPLRASMGDEIKLTNGIISSKSGFQGDVTSYQISAPIQPGNSGGPLFDKNGNLIGIVNAKHLGAENASYAVKASYLLNLFDIMSSPPKLPIRSIVNGKPLTEQVKILKKFIYIIEVN